MSDYVRSDLDIYFFSKLVSSNEEQHSTTITRAASFESSSISHNEKCLV